MIRTLLSRTSVVVALTSALANGQTVGLCELFRSDAARLNGTMIQVDVSIIPASAELGPEISGKECGDQSRVLLTDPQTRFRLHSPNFAWDEPSRRRLSELSALVDPEREEIRGTIMACSRRESYQAARGVVGLDILAAIPLRSWSRLLLASELRRRARASGDATTDGKPERDGIDSFIFPIQHVRHGFLRHAKTSPVPSA